MHAIETSRTSKTQLKTTIYTTRLILLWINGYHCLESGLSIIAWRSVAERQPKIPAWHSEKNCNCFSLRSGSPLQPLRPDLIDVWPFTYAWAHSVATFCQQYASRQWIFTNWFRFCQYLFYLIWYATELANRSSTNSIQGDHFMFMLFVAVKQKFTP